MSRTLAVAVMMACLAMVAVREQALALEPDWNLLNRDQVQAAIEPFESDTGVRKRAVAMVILPTDLETAWKILSDWDSMGEYVPNLKYYRTVYLSDSEKFIAGCLRILWINIDYPLWVQCEHSQNNHTWRMLKDEELPGVEERGIKGLVPAHFAIDNIEGYWKIQALDEHRTLFIYSLLISTKIPVPDAVEAYLSKLTLPNFMAAVRQRVIDKGATSEPVDP